MISTFTIPGRPPSINNMYVTSRFGHRHLSKKATDFKKLVKNYVKDKFIYDSDRYAIETEIYFYLTKVITRNGRISKTSCDLDGIVKAVQDSVFDQIGVDDSQICKSTLYKIDSEEDKTVFIIKTIPITLVKNQLRH